MCHHHRIAEREPLRERIEEWEPDEEEADEPREEREPALLTADD